MKQESPFFRCGERQAHLSEINVRQGDTVVRGHRIDPPAAEQVSADEPEQPERASTWTEKYLQGIIAGVIGTAGIIGIPLIVMKIRKKRK